MRRVEVAVVGGGPAGAAAAIRLARAGAAVTLLERSTGPHEAVCGEFLSGAAVAGLAALGIDAAALGGHPIARVALACGRRRSETALPSPALGLPRQALDERLRGLAAAAGAAVVRGAHVRAVVPGDRAGWDIGLGNGARLRTRDVFLATGKHDARGWPRPTGAQPGLVGFKLHLALRPAALAALGACVELVIFPGGYGGLQPVGGGRANLCLLVGRPALAGHGGDFAKLLAAIRRSCPLLDDRLAGAAPCRAAPLAVARIPFGFVRDATTGPWWLGDQAAVIPSFSGEGIALALTSAERAAAAWLAGEGAAAFQRAFAAEVGRPVARATLVSKLLVRRWVQAALPPAPALLRALARAIRIDGAAAQQSSSSSGSGEAARGATGASACASASRSPRAPAAASRSIAR